MKKNLFATVLTYPAPSANYRGESEENRSVMQKVTDGRFEYPVISPEAMRNALREMLRSYGLPSNRERLHTEDQLAVKFSEYPDANKFADDFFFGYLMALDKAKKADLKKAKGDGHPYKRDSILRMNLAKGLTPYRFDALFTQSPVNVDSPWKNSDNSALLHRETAVTAFQYPLAFNLLDVFGEKTQGPPQPERKKWFAKMLQAISELTDVAGNHARSLYFMSPSSIVIRLTDRLVPGYDSYGFIMGEKGEVSLPEVVEGVLKDDFSGNELHIGGTLIKQMDTDIEKKLKAKGVRTYRMADQALAAVSEEVNGINFLASSK